MAQSMSTEPLTNALQQRPGGRSADITRRIHDVVLALIQSGGAYRCNFQTVARRAKVERSTLYRRYPSRWAMMSEAFAAALASTGERSFRTEYVGTLALAKGYGDSRIYRLDRCH